MLYWYDYETLGPNPRRDRPAQFAGVRTDGELNVISDPLVLYCKPTPDYLPVPESCQVHGISPMKLLEDGVPPAQFAERIHAELSTEGSCGVGYNAVSFDHEFTRFLFYRNLLHPYRWHYDRNCSRWDIIDLLRAAFALRPDGIEWPLRDDGAPSFKLADIAEANGILQQSAHDALSDVLTTIAVARLVKKAQPKLYSYYFGLRIKENVWPHLRRPSLYVSGLIGAANGNVTVVAPLCRHPEQKNSMIVFDLRRDPDVLTGLSAEEIRARLFTTKEDLPEGVDRPPLYEVRANASPFLAPVKTINRHVQGRLGLDVGICRKHFEKLRTTRPALAPTVSEAYEHEWPENDVDEALYDEFIPDSDHILLERLRAEGKWNGNSSITGFADSRLPELVFRYRARNYGKLLSSEHAARWKEHCRRRHLTPDDTGTLPLDGFDQAIADLRAGPSDVGRAAAVLDELGQYGQTIRRWLA